MPEAADPMASVGYLVAAASITVVALGAYVATLVRRLSAELSRNPRRPADQPADR